jgi:hypothetical protein
VITSDVPYLIFVTDTEIHFENLMCAFFEVNGTHDHEIEGSSKVDTIFISEIFDFHLIGILIFVLFIVDECLNFL